MNHRKKALLALILSAAALCASCSPEEDDPAVGGDWRTWGIITASGTIEREGEEIPVQVCIHTDDADFYLDDETQTLFDSVVYPASVANAKERFSALSFDDLDGDGNSDVTIHFQTSDAEATEKFVWLWNEEFGYVYNEGLSVRAPGDALRYAAEYAGLWRATDDSCWLTINTDASWSLIDAYGASIGSGASQADAEGIELFFDENGDTMRLSRTNSGDLAHLDSTLVFVPADEIVLASPMFEEEGLDTFLEPDSGKYELADSVSVRNAAERYYRFPSKWEVTIDSDTYAANGEREIEFSAVNSVPDATLPDYAGTVTVENHYRLFDLYTGLQLPLEQGEKVSYTLGVGEGSVPLTLEYSSEWILDSPVYQYIDQIYITVRMPANYDGLVFAAFPCAATYRQQIALSAEDPAFGAMTVSNMKKAYTENALYFRIQ